MARLCWSGWGLGVWWRMALLCKMLAGMPMPRLARPCSVREKPSLLLSQAPMSSTMAGGE